LLKKNIEELQYTLNKLIESNYEKDILLDEIYKSSIELDQLIVAFYKEREKLNS